ncbi:hypothetical protein [Nocardioides perillae]|uniref:Uncharacterized protein n=1 Tax=Nocardioides perillae TaxID=1119534 RepID=A0A7Y9RU90_9ACTN|nr:hypothetical protein [Nocardioides perillae]NYG54993.1 hypothetical protein [Nocardioides perillae]
MLRVPLSRLASAAHGLEDAGLELDRLAGPDGDLAARGGRGDLGDAASVVAAALAAATDAASRVSAEAHVLGTAVHLTGEDVGITDAEAVVAQFQTARPEGGGG